MNNIDYELSVFIANKTYYKNRIDVNQEVNYIVSSPINFTIDIFNSTGKQLFDFKVKLIHSYVIDCDRMNCTPIKQVDEIIGMISSYYTFGKQIIHKGDLIMITIDEERTK